VDLQTHPREVRPGEQVTIRLSVADSQTRELVQHFDTVHEKPFHLFIISQDLSDYQHIHPVQQPDGAFVIDTILTRPGPYYVVSDFSPSGGWPQVVRGTIATHGGTRLAGNRRARLIPDPVLQKTVNGTRFHLSIDPPQPAAGVPLVLNYQLTDARSGAAVTDLQPYLGAWGHTVILHEDGHDYVHSHPRATVRRRAGQRNEPSPATIAFDSFFPRPGRYRIWSQFQRQNEVSTVSFDLEVAELNPVAVWTTNQWRGLHSANDDVNGLIRAVAVSGNSIYAGGEFSEAGSLRVNHIMKWDGREWSRMGEGVNGTVWAIAVNGTDVYVAGEFTSAGGTPANRVAKWDGRRWSALREGISGCRDSACSPAVYALAMAGNELYAGGRFSRAGTSAANGIARWNGNVWAPLGDGMRTGIYDGVVRALAASGRYVYAGGTFNTAGSTHANNIARWDGNGWQPLGSGVGGGLEQVLAVSVRGNELYAGGNFTKAGNVTVSNAAVWNGQEWGSLGFLTDAPVHAIATDETRIYIAGSAFHLPSGETARGVIAGNRTWLPLGSGISNGRYLAPVLALSVAGKAIYAGGGPFAMPVPR
jgi:hypothetical protein